MSWQEDDLKAQRHFEECILKVLNTFQSLDEKVDYLEDRFKEFDQGQYSEGLGSSFNHTLANLIIPLLYEYRRARERKNGKQDEVSILPNNLDSFKKDLPITNSYAEHHDHQQSEIKHAEVNSYNISQQETDKPRRKPKKNDPTFHDIFLSIQVVYFIRQMPERKLTLSKDTKLNLPKSRR